MGNPKDETIDFSLFLPAATQSADPVPEVLNPPVLMSLVPNLNTDPALRGLSPPVMDALLTLPRNDAVRHALLRQAQWQFVDGALPQAQTGYERELQADERQLDSYFLAHGAKDPRAGVILDPVKFDAGIALGIAPETVVTRLINGAAPDDPDVKEAFYPKDRVDSGLRMQRSSVYNVLALESEMQSPFFSSARMMKNAPLAYAQNPEENDPVGNLIPGSVITPSSEKTDPLRVPGLSYSDNLDYTNKHEMWHARDTRVQKARIDPKVWDKMRGHGDGDSARTADSFAALPDDPEVFKAAAIRNQMESFADTGALGDMIRAGKPLALLNEVQEWRRGAEIAHYTVPSLEGLKQKIQDMGIDRFRKLDDDQARALYEKTVDENALNARDIAILRDIHSPGLLSSAKLLVNSFFDPEIAKTRAFDRDKAADAELAAGGDPRLCGRKPPFDADNPELPASLKDWNPSQALQDAAFDRSRKITPETMIEAYVTLQDGLESKARAAKDPAEEQVYLLQMNMLQSSLRIDVPSLDYLKLNKDRGVDLAAAEPALRPLFDRLDEQQPDAAKPAAKPPPAPKS